MDSIEVEGVRGGFFLGLDLSTQGLQAMLLDAALNIEAELAVSFDDDLPEFGTEGGAIRGDDGLTVTSPALMWVAAMDLALDRMRAERWPLGSVRAVSGSGQQHGSVWIGRGRLDALRNLDASRSMREQLEGVFSREQSPIWMDSSTTAQCRRLEAALGGPQAVAELTGSRAYERFTGNQIARIREREPATYEETGRIALVSSFAASLLAGEIVPIDFSDGSGMNLMDIRRRTWSPEALDATAPGLAARLGEPVASHVVVARMHGRHVERYGFDPACRVVAFSGDNPNSLAGLMLREPGDLAISLGTSDTLFGSLKEPRPSASEGHIFVNPVEASAYMAMICRKNGSLTRELVRDGMAEATWEAFSEALASTPPGNGGEIGFYVQEPEITPPLMKTGIYRFGADDAPVEAFARGNDVRAVIESQFMAMLLHGERVGLKPRSMLATGGASANAAILQVIADVFGVPVLVGQRPGSAALGAAYRALHGHVCDVLGREVPFGEALAAAPGPREAAAPDAAAHACYEEMLKRYERLESQLPG
jgi:xylulokinase